MGERSEFPFMEASAARPFIFAGQRIMINNPAESKISNLEAFQMQL
jgi:hypothetical protein